MGSNVIGSTRVPHRATNSRLQRNTHARLTRLLLAIVATSTLFVINAAPAHARTGPLCEVSACLNSDETPFFCTNSTEEACLEFPNCCDPDVTRLCPGACTSSTSTPTPTHTNTPEPTATETPQATATHTYTATATATYTFTVTATHTATATFTNSPEPTYTNTPQPSSTNTPQPTSTFTHTATATATHSPEPTRTNTPRPSATDTPRPSATHTATATATETATPSGTSPGAPPALASTATATPTATSSAALITLSAECIDMHKDGTFTSYFSYNNTSGVELSIETDASSGTMNRMEAEEDSLLAPPLFKAGIARGAVVVQHRSNSVTWTVKVAGSDASSATVDSQTPRCRPIEPLASCEKNGIVVVGYNNPNSFPINIPYGPDNFFSAGLDKSKSITNFSAGRLDAARTLELNAATKPHSWTLRDRTVDLDAVVAGCQTKEVACMNVYSGEVIGNLDQVALELSSIAQRTAQTLQQARRKSIESSKTSHRVKKLSVNRIEVELKRALTRAKNLEEEAYRLTIQLPKVTKSCIDAPAYCETIDRLDTFIALRRLYAHLLNMTKRQTNRFYFTEIRETKRNRAPVVRAKRLVRFGHGELDKLPRLATDCT